MTSIGEFSQREGAAQRRPERVGRASKKAYRANASNVNDRLPQEGFC
jgi:hypothetical protein